MNTIEQKLIFWIKVGVFLILLTPLIVNSRNVFPAIFTKTIYFRLLVEAIFCLYCLLLITNRNYLPKFSPLFLSIAAFIAVFTIATIIGINPLRSFWGTTERMDGLLMILHLFLFFIVLVSVFKKKDDWYEFLKFSILVSVPVALLGIGEKLGIFSFSAAPGPLETGLARVSGTLGNPVFYGSYLVMIIFLGIFLAILEENKKTKILLWLITGLNLLMVLMTSSRGAWLGLFVGAFLLAPVWILLFRRIKEKRQTFFLVVFVSSLLFFLFLLLSESGSLPTTEFFIRYQSIFANILKFEDNRIFAWKAGLEAFKQRPLFGFGPDSFSYIFDKYYQSSFYPAVPETLFFDRPHNKIIELLVFSGLAGLLGYLAIYVVAIFSVFKNAKTNSRNDPNNSFASFILIAFLLGYFGQNLFAIDTISCDIIFFLVLAFVNNNFAPLTQPPAGKALPFALPHQLERSFLKRLAILAAVALTIISVFYFNIFPYFSNLKMVQGQRFFINGYVKKGFDYLSQSFSHSDFSSLERSFSTLRTLSSSKPFLFPQEPVSEERKLVPEIMLQAAADLEKRLAEKPEPLTLQGYLLLAQFYKDLYHREQNPKFLEDEERVINKAINFNPQFLKSYRLFGEMRILQGREEEGEAFLKKAYGVDKNIVSFNEWLGISLAEAGQKEKGAFHLRQAMKLGDFYTASQYNPEAVQRIVDIYIETNNYSELARFLEEVISHYPKEIQLNPQLYASLAATYAKIGEKEKARQVAVKMFELFPQLAKQREEFMEKIEAEQ